ncbi:translational activator gcn1 [Ceratobasidium sp. AG-Ba]|nr:translational activator gcn1 [Ceratobasidium sp. AG-Ba]
MSKADIHSWIAAAQDDASDDGQAPIDVASATINEEEWAMFKSIAQKRLLGDGQRGRIEFIKEQLGVVAARGGTKSRYSTLLMLTYPRYSDSDSRNAVINCLNSLLRRDIDPPTPPPTASLISYTLISWIFKESSHSLASSNSFVLLTWIAAAFTACAKSETFPAAKTFNVVVATLAVLVDAVVREGKAGASRSAFVLVRRVLRNNHTLIPGLITSLVEASKSSSSPLKNAVLLGIAVDVSLRLLPNKPNEQSPGVAYMTQAKPDVLNFYTTHVISSKTVVPSYITKSFDGFIQNCITDDDLSTVIIPAIEKAVIRAPELSLDTVDSLLRALSRPLPNSLFTRVLTSVLAAAKSTNALARAASVRAFTALLATPTTTPNLLPGVPNLPAHTESHETLTKNRETARQAVLAPLKENKANSADHRATLVAMLAALPLDYGSTVEILGLVLPSIAKDGKEDGWAWVGRLLHGALAKNEEVPKDIVAILTKEMASTKVPIKRAVCTAVGSALWDLNEASDPSPVLGDGTATNGTQHKPPSTWTPAASSFLTALTPALESSLKTASATPLNLPAGPLEGYVAAAIAFGRGGKEGLASKNPVLTGIAGTSTKPSFLLWDKVWSKVNEPIEEAWLLRAAAGALDWFEPGLSSKKNEGLRASLGAIFVRCAVGSSHHSTRRLALDTLSNMASSPPSLRRPPPAQLNHATSTKPAVAAAKPTAGAKPTTSSAAPDEAIQNTSRPDPKTMIQARYAALLAAVAPSAEHVDEPLRGDLMAEMIGVAHREEVCPRSRQLWVDLCLRSKLDPHVLVTRKVDRLLELALLKGDHSEKATESAYRALTTIVFIAPKVTLPHVIGEIRRYLSPAQVDAFGPIDFAIWRTPKGTMFNDVLASKKGPVLNNKSKDADIEKWEAELRKTLEAKKGAPAKAYLNRPSTCQCTTRERGYDSTEHSKGSVLVGSNAFETYLDLANMCSDRLGVFKKWIGVATLRVFEVSDVPEELQLESLDNLVVRVLYRLRMLSEQAPFDPRRGVAAAGPEEALEQVSLALDIIQFHCGEFSNSAYPRIEAARSLIYISAKCPRLPKTLGQRTVESTLAQEVYVRNACLQALQPFDLTESEWSPEIWIACHDDDEQNARLARQLWDDNGLDIPNHENKYVRTATGEAIGESAAALPATVGDLLMGMEEFYREKAKILAPEFDEYGMVIESSLDRADPWPARAAVADAFRHVAPSFTETEVVPFFEFLVKDEALGDRHSTVRRNMLDAGIEVIDLHGGKKLKS